MKTEQFSERITEDTEFLSELLVDPNILTGEPSQCLTEVGKRALDIYFKFESAPDKIKFGDLQDLVTSKGSQIGNKGDYLAHISNAAGVLRSLVITLGGIHMDLDLPHPDVAYSMGLVHDLNATFSDYARGGQQSKEFDGFLLAKRLGWKMIAGQVAMHSDYLGVVRLMSEGVNFPKEDAYNEMRRVLQGDGPLSYKSIEAQFTEFLRGEDNLPLMVLSFADYMTTNSPYFDGETLEGSFKSRSEDIMWRYHGKALDEGKTPSLLGQALANGGIERMTVYKDIVSNLLRNDPKEVEKLRSETKLFRS